MKNKNGFISVAIVYSFLIVFVMLLFGIMTTYLSRNNHINKIVTSAKVELENE